LSRHLHLPVHHSQVPRHPRSPPHLVPHAPHCPRACLGRPRRRRLHQWIRCVRGVYFAIFNYHLA
jgi:hypothetical protein